MTNRKQIELDRFKEEINRVCFTPNIIKEYEQLKHKKSESY